MQDSNIKAEVDYTSTAVVEKLLADEQAYLSELRRVDAIHIFLLRLQGWKNDSEQRKANGLPLDPPPVPPVGYVVAEDKPVAVPPPSFTPVVGELNQFGQYPAPGDGNPAGMVIIHDGLKLRKVVGKTPFGEAHWWERAS